MTHTPDTPSVVTLRKPVNDDLVEVLEGLLKDARNGDIVSCQFCGLNADGTVVTSTSSSENQLLEIAAVTRLLHRLNRTADGGMIEQ